VGTSVASRVLLWLLPLPEVERSIFNRGPNRRCLNRLDSGNAGRRVGGQKGIFFIMTPVEERDTRGSGHGPFCPIASGIESETCRNDET
jgi:hypothetical protein